MSAKQCTHMYNIKEVLDIWPFRCYKFVHNKTDIRLTQRRTLHLDILNITQNGRTYSHPSSQKCCSTTVNHYQIINKYFCQLLPMSYLIDQHRLLFWQKTIINDNVVLFTLSRLILNQFIAVGSRYDITSFSISPRTLFGWKFGTRFSRLLCHTRSPLRMYIAVFNWFYCTVY